MADPMKNLMIGIFVACAFAIVIFMMLFLHPSTGDEGRRLYARFTDIDKVSLGTRVTFAGKPVGEVVGIKEIEDVYNSRKSQDGRVYVYELELLVDSGVNVFDTDEISLRTSGLLGEKSISIIPRAGKPGQQAVMVNDTMLYAVDTSSVEETLKDFKQVAERLDTVLDNVNDMLNEIRERKIIANIGHTARNISRITGALDKPNKWEDILDNAHQFSSDVVATWPKVDEAISNFGEATSTGKTIFADISAGKGSFGRIMVDEDLYLKISALLNKGEVVMNDINHYGLLFHLDKGWKRLRARRMNLMQKLCSPQEFRNFFNDEIDEIATSIARVSMLLDGCDCACPCDPMYCSGFKKVFAELLRRVTELEENIQMYNEQLTDVDIYTTELGPCCQ